MIVYGWRGKVISGEQIQDMECPNCGKNAYLTFGILRYFHIFWIPLFPFSRQPGLECQNCTHTQMGAEIRDPVRGRIKEAVFTTMRTVPMFAGMALIATVVAFVAFSRLQDAEQERLYLANPEIGDMYVARVSKLFEGGDPKYDYVLMRVESVDGDQVGFKAANMQYDMARGPNDDIKKGKTRDPDYYGDRVYTFGIDELSALRDDGGIRSIVRK